MSKLFDSTKINEMTLKNRFVRSATWEGMAKEDGSCTSKLVDLMVHLAENDLGMIITGHAYVRKIGQAGPWQLGIYSDKLIPGLTEMAEAVHSAGGKIVVQLAHAGCHAAFELTGMDALGASVREMKKGQFCWEMTETEIRQTVEAFGKGAERAKKAGFDGVQIHAAHGYLLSQFLSPFYNKRKDAYGGTLDNRARMVIQVLEAVRSAVGGHFPVLIKMNSEDFVAEGLQIDEMLQVAKMLEKSGIDAIEMSGGDLYANPRFSPIRRGKINSPDREVYYREAARRYQEKIHVPLMLVGGIRSYSVAEALVNEGITDYISFSRPLIREPNLISRWEAGDTRKATCQSDNLCFKPARKGEGIYCVVEERERLRRK